MLPDEIREHYRNEIDEDARIRSGIGQLEFLRTQEIVRRHLGPRSRRIADVGGATGVHAEWLLDDGHHVDLVDPVADQVEVARRRLGRRRGFRAHVGNALALQFPDATFDAVLLLGPLYHLTERDDRVAALIEAGRVVRPGGLVIGAAISRFASLLDGLDQGMLFDDAFLAIVKGDLADGHHRNPDRVPGWFTTAYLHHPDELMVEAAAAGLAVTEVVAVEGPPALFREAQERWLEPAARERLLWAVRAVETEPTLIGASPHLLLVAERPPGESA